MRRAALGHEEMIACADCGRAGECASVQRGVSECATVCDSVRRGVSECATGSECASVQRGVSECATVCDSVQRGVSVQQGVSVRVCNGE